MTNSPTLLNVIIDTNLTLIFNVYLRYTLKKFMIIFKSNILNDLTHKIGIHKMYFNYREKFHEITL